MGRIQCANSLSNFYVAVVRWYYAGGMIHENLLAAKLEFGNGMYYIKMSVAHLENGMALSTFRRSSEIAQVFSFC